MHGTAVLTYTVTDIKRAFEHLEADLRALVQRTGLRTSAWAVDLTADVLVLAIDGYLERFDLMLYDDIGRRIRARTYRADDGGSGSSGHSGDNRWPRTPGGQLTPVITYNHRWANLSSDEQALVKKQLRLAWAPTDTDTSYDDLSPRGHREYSQNAARLTRQDYA